MKKALAVIAITGLLSACGTTKKKTEKHIELGERIEGIKVDSIKLDSTVTNAITGSGTKSI